MAYGYSEQKRTDKMKEKKKKKTKRGKKKKKTKTMMGLWRYSFPDRVQRKHHNNNISYDTE